MHDDDKYCPEYADETVNVNEQTTEPYPYKKTSKNKKYGYNNYDNYDYNYGYDDYSQYPEEKYDQPQSTETKKTKDKVVITCNKGSLKEMFN